MITAHADLAPALAEADVLDWLEDLGLDVALGEGTHLLAFDGSDTGALIAEIDFYGLDGGKATQVRWHLHCPEDPEARSKSLVNQVRSFLEASPSWCIDAWLTATRPTAADPA